MILLNGGHESLIRLMSISPFSMIGTSKCSKNKRFGYHNCIFKYSIVYRNCDTFASMQCRVSCL